VRVVSLRPFDASISPRAFRRTFFASFRGTRPRAASSFSEPEGPDRHCYRAQGPAKLDSYRVRRSTTAVAAASDVARDLAREEGTGHKRSRSREPALAPTHSCLNEIADDSPTWAIQAQIARFIWLLGCGIMLRLRLDRGLRPGRPAPEISQTATADRRLKPGALKPTHLCPI